MATRSGASIGILISLAIFTLLSLVLFVLTVVFAAKAQSLGRDLRGAQSDLSAAVRPEERDDRWEELKREAGSSGTGVVRHLDQNTRRLNTLLGAAPKDSAATIEERLTKRFGADAGTMARVVDRLEGEVGSLTQQLDEANRAKAAAQADLQNSIDRMDQMRADNEATVAALTAEIDRTKQAVDDYRSDVQVTKDDYQASLASSRSEGEERAADLQTSLSEARDQVLLLQEQLDRCRGVTRETSLRPIDEATLVDGAIVAVDPSTGEVSINRGRRNHIVLGMTFEVYTKGTVIQPDAQGEYPQGKAAIEVIRVEDGTSRARIIRSRKGNPVISSDVLVNPVYDPNKTYRFCVYGNFDTDHDGVATAAETDAIRRAIEDWGGVVSDTIGGDTDFLVLGASPILPPEPKIDDPVEVIDRYLRLKRVAERYDELFLTAVQAGIPVLNQSRFFTLTGLIGQR